MKHERQLTGIILAGGKSSRMGTDKGLLEWNGKTFTEHIIAVLRELTDEIIIVSDNPNYEKFGFQVVVDLEKDKGPLGGIYTGLYHTSSEDNIVLSCDTPLLKEALLEQILIAAKGYQVCIPSDGDGRWEPLIGYYAKSCKDIFAECLRKNKLKMEHAIRQVAHCVIVPDAGDQFMNINTREDLNELP